MKVKVFYTLPLEQEIEIDDDTAKRIRDIDLYPEDLTDEIIPKLDTLGDNTPAIDYIYVPED